MKSTPPLLPNKMPTSPESWINSAKLMSMLETNLTEEAESTVLDHRMRTSSDKAITESRKLSLDHHREDIEDRQL